MLSVCAVCGHTPHNGVLRKWVLTLYGSKVTQEDIDQRRRYMGERVSDGIVKLNMPPSYRLVEEAVSNGTVWSPLPCPPLPSHPRELTLSDTEQPSLPMVHVFTVSVTTPTTTRVITSSPSYCDPPSHSLNLSSPISLSLGHPLPSPSPFYLLPVVPFSPPLLFPSFPPSSSGPLPLPPLPSPSGRS